MLNVVKPLRSGQLLDRGKWPLPSGGRSGKVGV